MTDHLSLPVLLLITDNPSISHWFRKNLAGQYFLIDAMTRAHAIEIVQTTDIQFVVLDSNFEEIDPLALARSLRGANTTVPIFLITGRLKKTYRASAIQSGVTDFLNDQPGIDELKERLALGKRTSSTRNKTTAFTVHLPKRATAKSSENLKRKMFLNERALRYLAEKNAKNIPITLLMLRIDQFSTFSNREELLSQFTKRIQESIRSDDFLLPSTEGRFTLLLANTSLEETRRLAEKLRRKVQHEPFWVQGQKTPLTISIAISPIEANEAAYQKTTKSAVKALKQSQTNFIISLDEETL